MRENMGIYRGKRLDNGEWVEGYLYEHQPPLQGIVTKDYMPEKSKWYILKTAFADWNMPRQVEFIEIDPATVSEWTGLCDKNGTKAFEFSVVKWLLSKNKSRDGKDDAAYGIIEFCEIPDNGGKIKHIGFCIKWQNDGANMWGDWWRQDLKYWLDSGAEICGNIHDNPELCDLGGCNER